MREIVLDTETTGLSPEEGHRIVEIGAVELLNRLPTGTTYHKYFNPQRDMPKEAEAVHGLSIEFLKDKPLFKECAAEILQFIGDSPVVIHNASFDMKFITAEYAALKLGQVIPWERVVDTLLLARSKFPSGPNSLDALCRRFGIDNSGRIKHGALLDAELLAEVYLELTGGRQTNLGLQSSSARKVKFAAAQGRARQRPIPLPTRLSEAEQDLHKNLIASLGEESLWMKIESEA
jgi:DNA polymerase III subunit epsilon